MVASLEASDHLPCGVPSPTHYFPAQQHAVSPPPSLPSLTHIGSRTRAHTQTCVCAGPPEGVRVPHLPSESSVTLTHHQPSNYRNRPIHSTTQVPLNEYEFPIAKLANVSSQLERLVEKNYYLHQSAKDAYRAYLLAYNSHALKDTFNVHKLDLAVGGGVTAWTA